MLFHIERVSDSYKDFDKTKPPISGASLRVATTKSGTECFHWVVEVNSIEELAELGKRAKSRIIVDFFNNYWRMPKLLIYDDYIE